MNDERFPNPNGHAHDNDPQPARWADASETDADALDALLNEIAQGNGSPNPRSSRHHGPDVPTNDGDAVVQAARRFHDQFDAAEVRYPGSSALDPHLWETIMTTTNVASQGKSAQGTLWRDATRNAVSPGAATTRRPRQAPDHQSARGWSGFATATLALVILLTGFGVWRVYDGMNASVPADPEGTIPGLAMQPATPDATELPTVAAPPVSTPAPASACDFSADIPIFQGINESPIDGTALLLTTSGNLVLTCPEEPDPIRLASGIDQASPMNWPGIVSLIGEGEPGIQPISVINVLIGRSITLSTPSEAMASRWTQPSGTPWLISPVTGAPDDWAITDLRTMDSRPYSELSGVNLPEGTILNPATGDGNGTLVVVPWFHASLEDTGSPVQGKGTPGTALVATGSIDNAHTITLPSDLPPIVDMRLAPDGQHLALTAKESGGQPIGNTIYSIIRTVDGTEIARSGSFDDPMSTMRWVQDGSALVYTQHQSLMLLATKGESAPLALFEGNDTLVDLGTTYDPDVVIVHRQQAEEVATETPGLVQPRIYSVDTVSGDVIEIDGVDVSHNVSPWEPDTRFLVMGDTYIQDMDAEIVTFQVVDAVSGEVLDELNDVQNSQDPNGPMMGLRSVVSTGDGSIEVIGFGASQVYLLHEVDGDLEIRRLPTPNPNIDSYIGSVPLWLSNDGTQLSLTIDGDELGTRYLIDLTDADAAWLAVPSPNNEPGYGPSSIFFVPGTGD